MTDRKALSAVDLFCGAGGLTKGLQNSGIDVRLGVDVDPVCAYPYETNTHARFLLKRVEKLRASLVSEELAGATYKLLAGCAPCQPFSTYCQGRSYTSDERSPLLLEFSRLVRRIKPELVTMENVPRLAALRVFEEFVDALFKLQYHVHFAEVNCADYSVPQTRKRLVLLASRLGPIELVPPTRNGKNHKTVRQAIGALPEIRAGEESARDPLHQACALSETNLRRIKASTPGGSWRDWSDELITECHKKKEGKKYSSIYGRMDWNLPAPTLTTQFYNYGSGRYGHPEQDRAISFREGAIIQTFPKSYKFYDPKRGIGRRELGRIIGNAIPVKLAEAIGRSFMKHINEYG